MNKVSWSEEKVSLKTYDVFGIQHQNDNNETKLL